MKPIVLADTGPLVALFNRRDEFHGWAMARFQEFSDPLITAEPILVETLHLLRRVPGGAERLLALWSRGLLLLSFSAELEKVPLCRLLRRYRDVPISIADACLIRLSELHPQSSVWTLDEDFRVYRRNGRQTLSLITPA